MGPPERWRPPFQGFVQAPTVVFQPTVAKKWGNNQHYVGGVFSAPLKQEQVFSQTNHPETSCALDRKNYS